MIEDMRVRNFSLNTQKIYVDRVAKFAQYFGKSPELLGPEEIRTYQVYLIHDRNASWSTRGQHVSALRFLYNVTLGKEWMIRYIPGPQKNITLPVVLSLDEVSRFFENIYNLKHRAILMTAYGGGLRVSEVTSLRVSDIDSARMLIRIDQGKGRKDRLCAAAHKTGTSCSLQTCWTFCARIGKLLILRACSFQAVIPIVRSHEKRFTRPASKLPRQRDLIKKSRPGRSGIVLPPIF
jgi:site-specific recombinase XerD